MKYLTASAFRTALESRLLQQSRERNLPITRLRKLVVFERLLARLTAISPEVWILKGGVALMFRVGDDARTTKDLDLSRYGHLDAATDDMMTLESLDLNDYLSFSVSQVPPLDFANQGVVARYRVQAQVDGRMFEQVSIDVGFDFSLEDSTDRLSTQSMLDFAGLPPVEISAVPLERHVAEKVHAYTRTHTGNRVNTRVRDLVDIILIGSVADFRASRLREAFASTFANRAVQLVPASIPLPPMSWRSQYRQLAAEVDLDPDLGVGHAQAAAFLDPVLQGTLGDNDVWDTTVWGWRKAEES